MERWSTRKTDLLLVQTLRVDFDGVVQRAVVVGLEEIELDEDTKSCKACRKSAKRCFTLSLGVGSLGAGSLGLRW
jgi:hypothetical protein